MLVASVRKAAGFAVCLLTLIAGAAFAQPYQTTMQISPQGGGRCIEVPNREFVAGRGLEMRDCNSSAGQMFSYDQAGARLMIGGFCVDANGGQPGSLVKLWSCDGGANQSWKYEQKGNFAKLVGMNGLCLDIRYGS